MVNDGGSQIDPQLMGRLPGELATLGQRMHEVAADLARFRAQVDAWGAAGQVPPAAPAQPVYPHPPGYPHAWHSAPPLPAVPAAQPAPAREPWWQRDGLVSRVLAVAGGAVTVIGVVMLLVLAAHAGYFGPAARVVAGGVFSAALIAAGLRMSGRRGGRVGAVAAVGTGIAGGFLDVVAATSYYGWLPPAVGLAVAAVIACGGMVIATRWDSQPMAALVVLAVAVLAPVLADGVTPTLLAFLLLVQIAGFVPQLGRDWPYLHAARTLPVVFALLAAFAAAAVGSDPIGQHGGVAASTLVALAVAVAVVGVGTALSMVHRRAGDGTATAMLATSTVPLLLSGGVLARWPEVAVQCSLAAALLALLVAAPRLPGHTRAAIAAVAAAATLQASVGATPDDALPVTLLVLALGLVTIAGRAGSRIAFAAAAGFGILGAAQFHAELPLTALVSADGVTSSFPVLVAGVLLSVVAVLLTVTARSLGLLGGDRVDAAWIGCGVVIVYAGTAVVVTGAVAILGTDPGFVAGQCAATVAWMVLASALLRWGLTRPDRAHLALGSGLALAGAALTKLFLFDLATLDGVFRVLAFIGVGLLLLAAGARYARAFATGPRPGA
ncbi:DUF2339 domain-containing protein [Rhodococcus sp. NPDC058505]|uniref:DUF2339 domain-containing protein n=1 Tax=Rhodococcus sp. NPDC058505 TaxID=3346531 RepID=UPI0036626045